jgi:hypothetical protein
MFSLNSQDLSSDSCSNSEIQVVGEEQRGIDRKEGEAQEGSGSVYTLVNRQQLQSRTTTKTPPGDSCGQAQEARHVADLSNAHW